MSTPDGPSNPKPASDTPSTPTTSTAAPPTPNDTHTNPISPATLKLQTTIQTLQTQLTTARARLSTQISQLRDLPLAPLLTPEHSNSDEATLRSARAVVAQHIKLLKRYNEIRDIGMGLMEIVAEREGKRLVEVMREFEVDVDVDGGME